MFLVSGLGQNVVAHFADLLEIVVTLDDEAGKGGKRDCDECLHRNPVIHIVQVSLKTAEIVNQGQTNNTLCIVNSFARHNLNLKIRMRKLE